MECNKEDATKAKVIAEQKLTEKDFDGARKFALKAQALYPGLEGLSQLMMTIVVYISAENKIDGEIDWYGVLGVHPTADDETLKKHYRKLALMLHPDKNKCADADGAFKLLSEAWSLLSDKVKRLSYNQRRSSNALRNSTNRSSVKVKPPNTMARANPLSVPRPSVKKCESFWTTCQKCMMHYEYTKIYLNHTLLCPNCQQPFKAVETAPPSNYSKPPKVTAKLRQRKPAPSLNPSKPHTALPHQHYHGPPPHPFLRNPATAPNTGLGGTTTVKFQYVSSGKAASVGPMVSSPSTVAKAANIVQQANEKMKRAREVARDLGGLEKRRARDGFNGYVGNMAPQMATGDKVHHLPAVKHVGISTRELTPLDTRNMLIKKAKTEILEKLRQLSSEALPKAVGSKKGNVKQKIFVNKDDGKLNKDKVSNKTSTDTNNDDVEMNVPDPDFYEFDQDRMETSFSEDQVWAAYDDDDGMPRFYAMVHKVISLKPFKMRISWLASKSNSEFSSMNWVSSGFYKSCGEFKVGKPEITKSLNSFSHKVNSVKGPTGSICILPKKGEVWALYKNWSRDWNELTPDEVIHKYDMVQVLEDYKDHGVYIVPLIKVDGFKTVFRACTDPGYIRIVAKEEMLRFSHQIPNYLITGEEAKDAPKGLQELDPASTPFELIQVVTDANEKKTEENKKKSDYNMMVTIG